jgi:hypothetical protein
MAVPRMDLKSLPNMPAAARTKLLREGLAEAEKLLKSADPKKRAAGKRAHAKATELLGWSQAKWKAYGTPEFEQKRETEQKAEEFMERIQRAAPMLYEACRHALPIVRAASELAKQTNHFQEAGHYLGVSRQIAVALEAANPDVDWEA